MEAKEIPMQASRFSFEDQEMGPIPIAEILPAVLAGYALAGPVREDAAISPAGRRISTITVVEVGA
jgi:hypothetical protein